jgi:hypothetical protein
MAAIRRSFSGALARRRSASMTPEQKTEETKLERLTERFERGMRNLKTLEARLITVSGAARNFKTALADLGMSPLEDANGWPRGPTDVDVALVNADEHGIVGRIASACCAPLRRLVAEGNELRLLCKRRRDLVADITYQVICQEPALARSRACRFLYTGRSLNARNPGSRAKLRLPRRRPLLGRDA